MPGLLFVYYSLFWSCRTAYIRGYQSERGEMLNQEVEEENGDKKYYISFPLTKIYYLQVISLVFYFQGVYKIFGMVQQLHILAIDALKASKGRNIFWINVSIVSAKSKANGSWCSNFDCIWPGPNVFYPFKAVSILLKNQNQNNNEECSERSTKGLKSTCLSPASLVDLKEYFSLNLDT